MTPNAPDLNGQSEAPANKLSEEDRLKLALMKEQGARIKAQSDLLAQEHDQWLVDSRAVSELLRFRYQLSPQDDVSTGTGVITRSRKAAPSPLKLTSAEEAVPPAGL